MMRPMRDDLAEVAGAYQPPRALDAVAPPRQAAFAPIGASAAPFAAPPTGAGADALTRAFLQGANLHPSVLPQGLTPELMVVIGSLLRSATAGAVDMLAARAATKLEVQANVTIISAQANNPLKFLPNGDTALQQLLSKRMPGFMAPDEAMKDAFDDLRAHEIGVIAGTRAALAEVLGRFDPAVLGERLTGGSFLESLMPSVRKTKLWDIYLERYTQIRREAEDDFQSIFGRAFVQAYERETTRMKAKKTGQAG
jgi:type VI secretion system FHA domain protein